MKKLLILLVVICCIFLYIQNIMAKKLSENQDITSENTKRLQLYFEKHPDADINYNNILTLSEMYRYKNRSPCGKYNCSFCKGWSYGMIGVLLVFVMIAIAGIFCTTKY